MTLLLGIDTATTGCSVALMRAETCLAENQTRMLRGHSEALPMMIDTVMKSAGVSFDQLDGIAVTRGPGAFTGLRVGLAAARALALSINKPCIGISTFESLSAETRRQEVIDADTALIVSIESKRTELFVAIYGSGGAETSPPSAQRPDEVEILDESISSVVIVGDASEKIEQALDGKIQTRRIKEIEVPDAKIVATLALQYIEKPELALPTPFYLRAPDATKPKS